MLFSWNLLTDYLRLDIAAEALADRLSLVGLNHESTREVNGDLAVDLEVTSNRPDCLNHLGVAREVGLLLDQPVRFAEPRDPRLDPNAPPIAVENRAGDGCPRFDAITILGTRVGPSPWWLARRLETLGVRSINNVVDVTNYVMNELGQPIHAYDLAKLDGRRLVIRRAEVGEATEAINHQKYPLDPAMLVIADASRVVSIAGVMGCLNSEITGATTDIAIETARFDPLSIRRTARALGLQSPSSYRSERPIDPRMVRWARNRCVELILATGGGRVGSAASVGADDESARPEVTLRVARVARLLGIEIPRDAMKRILGSLGLELIREDADALTYRPPVWRFDLGREVDLVEEVGRIHGYDHVPEDRPVALGPIRFDRRGRVEDEVRATLTGLGFSEAITYSFVPPDLVGAGFADRPDAAPIRVDHATRKHANLMRLSLVPSLLEVASYNESHGNSGVRLFELAHTYEAASDRDLPRESSRLALLMPGDFFAAKGVLEALLARLHAADGSLTWGSRDYPTLRPGHAAAITRAEAPFGVAGEVDAATVARLKLREAYAVLEVSLDQLDELTRLVPQQASIPTFPGVQRDLSLVVPVAVTWDEVRSAVAGAVDESFEGMTFLDSFRGGKLAEGTQALHFALRFRHPERTLTGEEVDTRMARIVDRCRAALGASLRT